MTFRTLLFAAACAVALPLSGQAAAADQCSATVGASDAMRYDTASIAIPASCSRFTITLRHTGKLPVTAMGHDLVVAHTRLIGGGESTSVAFPVSKLQGGGPWVFFCSFPGHAALMKGTVTIR